MDLSCDKLSQLKRHLVSLFEEFLKDVMSADGPQGGEYELLDSHLDILHWVIGPPGNLYVEIYGSIDFHLDVVPGERSLLLKVYYLGLHVHYVYLICEGVEILQSWSHSLHVSSESLVNASINSVVPTKLWSICL